MTRQEAELDARKLALTIAHADSTETEQSVSTKSDIIRLQILNYALKENVL